MTQGDFWTRRKALVEAEEAAEAKALTDATEATECAELAERDDAEILETLNLPDPDTLEPGDDFSAFMAKAVPERLRRRALRKLWRSNPMLANLDTLVDYGEDFTDSAMAVEAIQTAYQVGKGMLKHIEALAAEAEAEDPSEDEVPLADDTPEETLTTDDAAEPEPVFASADITPDDEDITTAPAPARMRFSFAS